MRPRTDSPTVQVILLSSVCSGLDTVFLHDMYGPYPIYDLAATDASFEESRQIREAAMKAHVWRSRTNCWMT